VSRRSCRGKSLLELAIGNSELSVREGKLDSGILELENARTNNFLPSDSLNFNDLDAPESSTMTRSHIKIKLSNSSNSCQVSKFFVYVMCSCSTVITAYNSKILHTERLSLENLAKRKNFSITLLELAKLAHEVPEATLCMNGRGCKDFHAVDLWMLHSICGFRTADDLILVKVSSSRHVSLSRTEKKKREKREKREEIFLQTTFYSLPLSSQLRITIM